jgi:hypothetical protein
MHGAGPAAQAGYRYTGALDFLRSVEYIGLT